jgi:hypothetical protein
MLRRYVSLLIVLAVLTGSALAQKQPAAVHVAPYTRSNGTRVPGHYRTYPDNDFYNNFGTYPNINPFTGRIGTRVTPPRGYTGPGPNGAAVVPYNQPTVSGYYWMAIDSSAPVAVQFGIAHPQSNQSERAPQYADVDQWFEVPLGPMAQVDLMLSDNQNRINAADRIMALGVSELSWQTMTLPDLLAIEAKLTTVAATDREAVFRKLRDAAWATMLTIVH